MDLRRIYTFINTGAATSPGFGRIALDIGAAEPDREKARMTLHRRVTLADILEMEIAGDNLPLGKKQSSNGAREPVALYA